MSTYTRLTDVYRNSRQIDFNNASKFIIFSDCHRGINSWADNFARNQNLFFHALNHYYAAGFTYIEAGDGDELWEERNFPDIFEAHSDCFWLMKKLYDGGRFYMLRGNHDAVKKNGKFVKNNLWNCYNERTGKYEPLFRGMEVLEGLVLHHTESKRKLFIVHGHQGDWINDRQWKLGRFLVRHLLRPMQLIGFTNPTSPAKNLRKKGAVENKIIHWVTENKQPLLAGHTHRPMLPDKGQAPYFNSGSCVHPRCITGIEIEKGALTLVKWSVRAGNDGHLYIGRSVLAGPVRLDAFC